jgi:hypothetical protein
VHSGRRADGTPEVRHSVLRPAVEPDRGGAALRWALEPAWQHPWKAIDPPPMDAGAIGFATVADKASRIEKRADGPDIGDDCANEASRSGHDISPLQEIQSIWTGGH